MPSNPLWRPVFHRLHGLQERVRSGHKAEETPTYKLLQKVSLFQELSGRELHKIEEMLYGPRDWRARETIINQGDPGMGMYIIASGQVRVAQMGDDGVEKQLAILTRGDFFGEQALIDPSPRPASAYAVQPCSLLVFCRPDVLELLQGNTLLSSKMLKGLAQAVSADAPELLKKLSV